MRIQSNIMALDAYRNLTMTNTNLAGSVQKLSSGYRINKAADDAAGLEISNALLAQISGLTVATRNAQDGVSVVQTADGALNEISRMLNRMRDLAVQAANTGSVDPNAAAAAQQEVTALAAEITRESQQTAFGSNTLLDGAFVKVFQIGANAGQYLTVSLGASLNASALGVSNLGLASIASASAAITAIDTAITTVSTTRGTLGAFQNRFQSVINALQVTTENLNSSESQIKDTDMAAEMVNFNKQQILLQAGTAMLAQANAVPNSILKLLQ
jgi:flagellin